ncbi:MAG: exosortase F system-associated protein [Flavobacteriaceae bacterium]|nr:MAG: exosortase F system-associated protein [Flavobacteriaceae bacterium]
MKPHIYKYIGITICLMGLILVRVFQEELFYDPFLDFFRSDFNNQKPPNFVAGKLILSHLFRYSLNSLFTFGVLALYFQSKFNSLALQIMFGSFVLFLAGYFLVIHQGFNWGYTSGFYLRRFLIQPMWLILLFPAFFYVNLLEKESEIKS